MRQPDSVATYWIDDRTGRLSLTTRQDLGDIHQLAGEPRGRLVYAGYGRKGSEDPSIVGYATGEDGSLAPVSEARSQHQASAFPSTGTGWTWLAATPGRVYGIWTEMCIDGHSVPDYVTHAVTEGGQLAAAYLRPFLMDDPAAVTLDPGNDVFYKAAPPDWVDSTDFEGLTAHVVGADGRLDQTGRSDLCGGGGTQVGGVVPLFALRGVVFARAYAAGQAVVCSWQGARLAPGAGLGDIGLVGTGSAPEEATSPGLLAFASNVFGPAPSYTVKGDLRLLSLGTGTDVALLDLVELPAPVRQLLFDPSGRFLYASGSDGVLRAYAVGAERRLELVQELAGAGEIGWQRGWNPLSMAVTVRPGTPRL